MEQFRLILPKKQILKKTIENKYFKKETPMKKLLLLALCAITAQTFASESGDKEALKRAKLEERRRALNAKAAQLIESQPKQAAKLIAKSTSIDPNNPTGYYIAACAAATPAQEQELLAAAATSSRPSRYKDEARKILSSANSESAMAAFVKELNEKANSAIEDEELIAWITTKSKIFPDKKNFLENVDNILIATKASLLDDVRTAVEKL